MNHNYKSHRTLVAAMFLATAPFIHAKSPSDYAEAIYRDYSSFSNEQAMFTVETLSQGSMANLGNRKIGDFFPLPSYVITSSEDGVTIDGAAFAKVDWNDPYLDERNILLSEFDSVGLPISKGQVRTLLVTAKIGADVRTHQAVEFCWADQDHCVVTDNSMPWMESVVRGIRLRKAEGWRVSVIASGNVDVSKNIGFGTCALNSTIASQNMKSTATYRKPALEKRKTNSLGQLLYKGVIGEITGTMSCTKVNNACQMASSSQVDGNQCSAYRGYSVASASKHINPETTNRGKIDAHTACSFAAPGVTAQIGFTIAGSGINASVERTAAVGNITDNKLSIVDSCVRIGF